MEYVDWFLGWPLIAFCALTALGASVGTLLRGVPRWVHHVWRTHDLAGKVRRLGVEDVRFDEVEGRFWLHGVKGGVYFIAAAPYRDDLAWRGGRHEAGEARAAAVAFGSRLALLAWVRRLGEEEEGEQGQGGRVEVSTGAKPPESIHPAG